MDTIGPLVIDEIQRAPELLLPIKAAIDHDRRPGRFILTGSAQVMLLPKVSESLAGRVEVHTLWPFSQAEIEGVAKLLLSDSALLTHLLRADRGRLSDDDALFGTVLECFVGMELTKQLSAARARASLLHMRTATGAEVDFILEGADGRLAGIEVKASATVRGDDFKHLARMRDRIDDGRFVRGVVLYAGSERLPFGERLEAWPLATLWTGGG